jgi:hypothetical protein
MSVQKAMMMVMAEKVKAILAENEDLLNGELSPENAEAVSRVMTEAASQVWVEGFRTWLKAHETEAPLIEIGGKSYRYKLDVEKEFLTPGGTMTIVRRVYQPDAGGPCHVPLDAAWGMADEYATVEVRDAALYAVALCTPRETETLLAKSALFHPSATAIQHMAKRMGTWLEGREDELLPLIREEEVPPAETRVLCASLDGVNVLLAEPGVKRGRPAERPGVQAAEKESATCYKNAMVGSISLYGEVPEDEKTPARLVSRYAARMPEDRAPVFKRKFEAELRDVDRRLPSNVARILLNDGARGLWSYADENPLFDDYEKLVDFHHAEEHLSRAAETLFGKSSVKAERWYDRHRGLLLEKDDGAQRVLDSLDYYRRVAKLSASRRTALGVEETFFANNWHRMEYARFRRNGWPIGSGPVEAACKSIVKTRLGRSGMRWSRPGGQHILTLRTFVKSQRWDAMWKCYKRFQHDQSPQLVT